MIEKSSTTLGTRLWQETSLNFISYINLLKLHPNFLHALYCILLLLHLEDLIGCNEEGMSPNKINWLNFFYRLLNIVMSLSQTAVCGQEWQLTLMIDGTSSQNKGSKSSRISSIHPFAVTIIILHQVWCSQNTYREHKTIFHEDIPTIIISTYHTSE